MGRDSGLEVCVAATNGAERAVFYRARNRRVWRRTRKSVPTAKSVSLHRAYGASISRSGSDWGMVAAQIQMERSARVQRRGGKRGGQIGGAAVGAQSASPHSLAFRAQGECGLRQPFF